MPVQALRRCIKCLILCVLLAAWSCPARPIVDQSADTAVGVAIVEPVPDSTKLHVNEAGLELLRSIQGYVAPVAVIGPYRSGKSFLINQMLGISCDAGMTVGHQRTTQTRGVWIWSKPIPANTTGASPPVSILFFDTEGFESTGQSDAYDDRIFAFAAVISATLIYNLAEAVRESDIEKLSFAVELATAFYPHYAAPGQQAEESAARKHLEPLHMVWCIQRDFLLGGSSQAAVDAALSPVPNPHHDAALEQVNRIRQSIGVLAKDSVAFGLPQPHLERTRLCDLPDSDLSPDYLERRDALRAHLHATATPKTLRGEPLTGAGLADLVVALVDALNARELPTSGSMLEAFNQQLLAEVAEAHAQRLEALPLPLDEAALREAHESAAAEAFERLHRESFGKIAATLDGKLQKALDKELQDTLNRNELCETELERLAQMALPSLGRFDAKAQHCGERFAAKCVGPAAAAQRQRLEHARDRERQRFAREYNDKLYTGLVVISLVLALLSRFALKQLVLEVICWASFLFLEVYPKIAFGSAQMYEAGWWRTLVAVWELVVYNPVIDLERWWLVLLVAGLVALHLWRRRSQWPLSWKKLPASDGGRDLSV